MMDPYATACGRLERAGLVEYEACREALAPPPIVDPVSSSFFFVACLAAIVSVVLLATFRRTP
jgi:hypothetical protein